ncbi:MAG TPA: FAD-binding oxidoreductase [Conexibacter sp.]|jgi:FAD/FMN-containing dehydrogenase
MNTAVRHAPDVVVGATSATDVHAAVRFAAANGLPVGVISSGHGPSVRIDGGLLITTQRMTGVEIDPARRITRVETGVRWRRVVDAAAEHGLAPLAGSAETVGVVGYMLGGGLSVTMGRAQGWAADYVRAIEVVTPDGTLRRASADSEQDLFWALRGGKSNFGVVTALEFALFPVTRLYAGVLFFDGEHMPAVLDAWRRLTERAPDALTSSFALARMPAQAPVPAFMRGRLTVMVRISYLGDAAAGEQQIASLRAAAPTLADTVADRPYTEFDAIDPGPGGEPFSSVEQFMLLRELAPGTAEALVDAVGPDADSDLLLVDIRQLGGALRQPQDGSSSAAGPIAEAGFMLFTLTPVPPGDGAQHLTAGLQLAELLKPWLSERRHANFLAPSAAAPESTRAAFDDAAYARLRAIKAAVDPGNRFRFNYNIPPADRA